MERSSTTHRSLTRPAYGRSRQPPARRDHEPIHFRLSRDRRCIGRARSGLRLVGEVGASPGRRAGDARPSGLHDRDHEPVLADVVRRPLGLPRDGRPGRRAEGRRHGDRPTKTIAGIEALGRPRRRLGGRASSSRTRSTGTPRTWTGTSGTSARTRKSSRTARSRRPQARGSTASTAPRPASSCPPLPSPGSVPAGVLRR